MAGGAVTLPDILAHLQANPGHAFEVLARLRVAGPWVLRNGWWVRENPSSDRGGTLAQQGAPATAAELERADAALSSHGYEIGRAHV